MIGLALDAGSSKAGRLFSPLVMELNRLFQCYCDKEYFSENLDLVICLRVSGEIADFGFEGCDRLRENRKNHRMTIDVGIPSSRWKECSRPQVARSMVGYAAEAIEHCTNRLINQNQEIQITDLHADLERVFSEFQSCEVVTQ